MSIATSTPDKENMLFLDNWSSSWCWDKVSFQSSAIWWADIVWIDEIRCSMLWSWWRPWLINLALINGSTLVPRRHVQYVNVIIQLFKLLACKKKHLVPVYLCEREGCTRRWSYSSSMWHSPASFRYIEDMHLVCTHHTRPLQLSH